MKKNTLPALQQCQEIFYPKPKGRRVDSHPAHRVPQRREPDYDKLLKRATLKVSA